MPISKIVSKSNKKFNRLDKSQSIPEYFKKSEKISGGICFYICISTIGSGNGLEVMCLASQIFLIPLCVLAETGKLVLMQRSHT